MYVFENRSHELVLVCNLTADLKSTRIYSAASRDNVHARCASFVASLPTQ